MLLEGLQLPLTTPFYADGRLNLRKLEQNVAAYSKTPAAGLVALSRHGESSMLSDEESLQVLKTAIEAAAAEKVMLAGASRDSVLQTLALADHAARLHYDAILVEQPSFLRQAVHKSRELLTYFQSIADRSPIPLVLSSVVAALPAEVVIELAGHPRILGLVEGSAHAERMKAITTGTAAVQREVTVTSIFAAATGRMLAAQVPTATGTMLSADTLTGAGTAVAVAPPTVALKTRTKLVGFQILAGSTAQMLEALTEGAAGAISAFAACAPQVCYEVFAAWKDGDRGLAEEKQERLQLAANRIEAEIGVSAIKFGCDLNGYFGGLPRLPRLPLTGEQRQEVEILMQGLRS